MITSKLVWFEPLTKPLRDYAPKLARLFRAFLMILLPVTLAVSEQAARLRVLGLKTPDTLHAATALAYQYALFITNDPIFHRAPNLAVVVLAGV